MVIDSLFYHAVVSWLSSLHSIGLHKIHILTYHICMYAYMFSLICYHVICQLHRDILHFAPSHLMWLRGFLDTGVAVLVDYKIYVKTFFFSLESVMGNIRSPFKGIIKDIKGRSACYKQDWVSGLCSGFPYVLCFDIFGTTLCYSDGDIFYFDSYFNFYFYQDISSDYLYLLCFCSSCYCLWRAIESRYRCCLKMRMFKSLHDLGWKLIQM